LYRAVSVNLLGAAVYAIAASQTPLSPAELTSGISSAFLTVILAAVLAYTAERSERTHFLQEQLLGEIASRDGLTGLQNRAALDAHLDRVWRQALRTQDPIGLLLLDVDHFKGFNDSLGHQAGDACLRQVAGVLRNYARRPFDLPARYGGEEFAIVLYQTPPEQVRAIAEAVRASIEALGIVNPAAPAKVLTISCGVAIVTPVKGRSVHGLIQLADEALYAAKGGGRNCVRSADHYATLTTGIFRIRDHLRVVK
jgi:diguanylate cyclase (GGDEF)-like protein